MRGAWLNVRINCPDLASEAERAEFLAAAEALGAKAEELEARALAAVDATLS